MSIYNRIHALGTFLLISLVFYSFNYEPHNRTGFDRVKIEGGLISGTLNTKGDIHIFKGIPFAAPPVGDLRWKKPQPVVSWTGVKASDKFGPSPMQATPAPFSMWSEEFLIPKEPINEDCLYLNVWTGANSEKEKRPVIVWIYGGGFSSGGSAAPIYDGEAMAKKGIVFVSINYRVGIFGFFAHTDLSKESGNNASGNYGLMDQVAGLKWVQKNIAAFGGDPNNVTIAGQSAGSMSVNCLVASPLAKNLFKKAIAESGASLVTGLFGATTLQMAEQDGQKTAVALKISSLDELRKIPASQLLKAPQSVRGPIVDGYVLPESVTNIFAKGKENKADLLTGWNEDEGLLFGPLKSADEFKRDAARNYGSDSATFLQYYPAGSDSIAGISQLNLSRDQIFGVQNYTWANVQSNKGSKVFVYRFKRKVPATGEYIKYGAFHTGEVPYAYDNLKFVNRPWTNADHELATIMSSYWTNFAKTGNPNGQGLPQWDPYRTSDKRIMVLNEKSGTKSLPDAGQLDFLYNYMRIK
ncbi:carboxylesterase/lipase family protein [Flavitalea sp.]|nr:carboxylesterase family protein [Flavitalea sp.]